MEKNRDSDEASNYRTQAKALEETTKDMNGQVRSAKGSSSAVSLRRMEDTIIWTVQSLVGTYHSLRVEQEGALVEAELTRGKYEKAMCQAGLRMVSQAAADEARKTATTAVNKIQSLQDDMERVRKEPLMVTGCPGDSQIQIGMLPAPDRSHVGEITLEADKWRAFGNSYELRQQRGSSSGGAVKEYHVR